jgi:FHA domain-containing protein
VAIHCPECGFTNAEGANYCQRCGAYLAESDSASDPSTASFKVDETDETDAVDLDELRTRGPALVIRAGGGRAGEAFPLEEDRLTVGRNPDSDIFLDDVTVSRDHAIIVRRGADYHLDDCGSLNGTYVNRQRVESQLLRHGDELQIGKYKLAFLNG